MYGWGMVRRVHRKTKSKTRNPETRRKRRIFWGCNDDRAFSWAERILLALRHPLFKASVSSGVPPFPPCFRISGFAFAFLRFFPASLRFRLATVEPRAGQAEGVCRGMSIAG